MKVVRWKDVAVETITDGVERQVLWGVQANLTRVSLAKGRHVSKHHHPAEQFTYVQKGSLRMVLGARDMVMNEGDFVVISPNAEHEVWALDDSIVWDFFAPPRHDWKEGPSDYLAGR